MAGHVSLLAIVGLPLLAGLLVVGFAAAWRRWFGAEPALALAGRISLGGTLLAGMLVAAAVYALMVRPDLAATQPVAWAGAGKTTLLHLDLELGALALTITGLGLVLALAVQVAALGDPRDGARSLGRSALLLAGTALLALSATAWGAALGWQIVALVVGACGRGVSCEGHVVEDMSDETWPRGQAWARLGDAGVWLAVLATVIGAGDLGFGLISRGALLGEHASLLARAPVLGVTPAAVAAVGLAAAVLARLAGLPAALRGESPATRAALLGLASGAGVLLLLRMHMVLVLAPTVMAALTAIGGGVAVVAGVAGLRARSSAEALGRVAQAQLGLMLVAIGLGAWVPACGLLIGHALASGAAALGLGADGRAGAALRWLAGLTLIGLLPGGVALWGGEVVGVAFTYMSAWSPAINVVIPGAIALATVAIAGSMGHVLRDRSQSSGGPELALAAGLLTVVAIAVVAIDLPGSFVALRVWLGPELGPSWLLRGDYALGPLPPRTVADARWGAPVLMALAGVGLLLAPRLRAWASRLPTPQRRAPGGRGLRTVVRGLHELGELHVLPALLLGPTQPRVARAPRADEPRRALVLALFGTLGVLGVVYCNPDVAQLGPTRVYPVDVGGINPALLGTRRAPAGRAAESAGAGGSEMAPGTGAVERAVAGEMAPGTGAGAGGSDLAPGTGADGAGAGGSDLAPGTGVGGAGAGGMDLAPGTGAEGAGAGGSNLAPGTGASAGGAPVPAREEAR